MEFSRITIEFTGSVVLNSYPFLLSAAGPNRKEAKESRALSLNVMG